MNGLGSSSLHGFNPIENLWAFLMREHSAGEAVFLTSFKIDQEKMEGLDLKSECHY